MSADESGRRPKFAEGDIERSSRVRRYGRPSSGSIVESIDDDVTPLPQEPPDISQIDGFGELSPVLQRALTSLHNTTREHDVTFAKLWGARHVHEDVSELREAIAELKPHFRYLESVSGVLDQHGKQLFRVVQWIEGRKEIDAKLERTLESLDKRLDTVEADQRQTNSTMVAFGRDVADGFKRRDAELEALKAETQKRFEKLEADQKTKNDEYEKRIRSLEDTRLSMTAKAGAVSLLVVVLAWLVEHFWKG